MALFSAGLKLDRPLTFRDWSSVARLLLLAMPVTIGAVALLGGTLLGLSAAGALLLGAALAPTDPVLAGDIGVGPPGDEDEHEPNFALTAEAGLNDGLAAPFVLLGVFVAEEGGGGWAWEWLAADVVWAIGIGLAIGAVVGLLAAWSVKRLHNRGMLVATFDGFHAIATALVIYGLAELAAGYGFLAVFAGGLAFRRYERDHELNASVHEGAERMEKLLELAVILLLGSMLTPPGLGAIGWEGWLLAVLLLVLVRPLAVPALPRRLAAWTSPTRRRSSRGSACAASARSTTSRPIVGAGALDAAEQELVVWTCIAAVLISIVVHGLTAGPSLRRLLLRRRPAPRPRTSSRSAMRSSTAASSSGWWIGSSPGRTCAATRSSAGRIVRPAA